MHCKGETLWLALAGLMRIRIDLSQGGRPWTDSIGVVYSVLLQVHPWTAGAVHGRISFF